MIAKKSSTASTDSAASQATISLDNIQDRRSRLKRVNTIEKVDSIERPKHDVKGLYNSHSQAQQKKKVETMADGELLSALKAALVNIKEARTSSDEDSGDEWD